MNRSEYNDISKRLNEIEANFEGRIDKLEQQLAYSKGVIGCILFLVSCVGIFLKLGVFSWFTSHAG